MSGPDIPLEIIAEDDVLLGSLGPVDSGEYFVGDSGSYASLTSEDSLQAIAVGTAYEPGAAEEAFLAMGADAPSISAHADYGSSYRRQG